MLPELPAPPEQPALPELPALPVRTGAAGAGAAGAGSRPRAMPERATSDLSAARERALDILKSSGETNRDRIESLVP